MVRGSHLRLFAPWAMGIFSYSECCTDGELMVSARVNQFFALTHTRVDRPQALFFKFSL